MRFGSRSVNLEFLHVSYQEILSLATDRDHRDERWIDELSINTCKGSVRILGRQGDRTQPGMHSTELRVLYMKRLEHEKEIPQLILSLMAEFVMKICKIVVSILLRACEVVEEATRFLPCLLVLCWSARSHLGPPEFEIDDPSPEENPEIVERIKESLKDVNFTRSGATEGDDCTVCLSEFMETESVYKLPRCNHLFHKVCLNQWLLTNKTTCPLCRSDLEITQQLHLSEIPFQETIVSRYLIS